MCALAGAWHLLCPLAAPTALSACCSKPGTLLYNFSPYHDAHQCLLHPKHITLCRLVSPSSMAQTESIKTQQDLMVSNRTQIK